MRVLPSAVISIMLLGVIISVVIQVSEKSDKALKPRKNKRAEVLADEVPVADYFDQSSTQQFDHVIHFLVEGVYIEPGGCFAVRGTGIDYFDERKSEYWFVAALIEGKGVPAGSVGCWVVTGPPDNPRMTISVDGIAEEFSVCPVGRKTNARVTMTNRIAARLVRYVEST